MVVLGGGGSYGPGTPVPFFHENAPGVPKDPTGVLRSKEKANPKDLAVGLWLGPDDGPRGGGAVSYERDTPVPFSKENAPPP